MNTDKSRRSSRIIDKLSEILDRLEELDQESKKESKNLEQINQPRPDREKPKNNS